MQAERRVTVIPAKAKKTSNPNSASVVLRRVAAYARVSTDSDEQLTSYEAQIGYYTDFIESHPGWLFAGMYSDEGISGVMTKHRDGFNQMISDAISGKIDLIITKSISRFARNTVDMLTNVRLLKEYGVEVYFEKENIYSLDSKGEVLMTIMGSMAQEESRSISENVKWGIRKRFSDGKVTMPYTGFLGYKKGEDGLPEIVPEEAEIVRKIYRLFIQNGKTPSVIASMLTKENIPTPRGKEKWTSSTVRSILQNEKYRGSALLQKTYIEDYLTKRPKVNDGIIPQYYVEESHPAIIDPDEWDQVQLELERRKSKTGRYRCDSPLSGKLVCGNCGGIFGSKVWHSNDKYRCIIWQCNDKYSGNEPCTTPHIKEDVVKELFLKAIKEYFHDTSSIVSDLKEAIKTLKESDPQKEIAALDTELEITARLMTDKLSAGEDTHELYNHYKELEEKQHQLEQKHSELHLDTIKLKKLMKLLENGSNLPIEFDERLWTATIDSVTVYAERLVFHFFDGTEITEII